MQRGRGLDDPVDAGEEGIGLALPSDGRFGSMSAVHDCIVGKWEQLAFDAGDQRLKVAARQIGPSNRSSEQHVTAEDNAMPHQAHAPGRVSRGVAYFKAQIPDFQLLACNQVAAGGGHSLRHHKAEPRRLLPNGVIKRAVSGMEPYDRACPGCDFRHPEDMIDMRMREPDGHGLRVGFLDLMENQTGFFARIDDDAQTRLLVDDDIGVLGEHAIGDLDDLHFFALAFALPSPCCSRNDLRYFSTAIAAVVASPTAVVICRVTWLRTSPAANSPAIDVIMRLSVIR